MKRIAASLLVVALALSACSTTESSTAAPTQVACPTTPAQPQGRAPGSAAGKIVVPVDSSTSTVIPHTTEPQIQCGPAELDTHRDITYSTVTLPDGKSLELKLDVLAPKTDGAKPLVIYVPGGGFASAVKELALDTRTFVAQAGYVVASVQYRTLTNGAVYTDGVADVKSAIAYLRTNAAQYGIDPAKVGLWGESAGGYLVSMVGVTSPDVQAVVSKFGASDLSKITADFDPATQQALTPLVQGVSRYVFGPTSTKSLADDPAAVAAANPVTQADSGDPAFEIFHGTADMLISPSQTLMLHNGLRAAGVNSTRYLIEGAGHGDAAFTGDPATGLPWTSTRVMGLMTDFFAQHLK